MSTTTTTTDTPAEPVEPVRNRIADRYVDPTGANIARDRNQALDRLLERDAELVELAELYHIAKRAAELGHSLARRLARPSTLLAQVMLRHDDDLLHQLRAFAWLGETTTLYLQRALPHTLAQATDPYLYAGR